MTGVFSKHRGAETLIRTVLAFALAMLLVPIFHRSFRGRRRFAQL